MSMCRVVSCIVRRGCLLWPLCFPDNTVSLCPPSFCTPRPNLSITPGISWFPTFVFHSPIMKMTSILGVSSRSSSTPSSCRTVQLQLHQCYWSGHRHGLLWISWIIEWFALEMNRDHSVVFETASKYCISDSFVDCNGYSISSNDSCPQ